MAAASDNDANIDETKVDIAARFLSNSNVMGTEIENQESFLKNKGLNPAEIKLAFQRVNELKEVESQGDSWSILDYLKGVVLASGILSAANYAYKAYVLPYATRELKDDARMEILVESFQDVKDDIKQHTYELTGTLKQMQQLMEENRKSLVNINAELNREKEGTCDVSGSTAAELKTEISLIKSMMLSREQFRATPFTTLKPKTNEIPAWQQIADEMANEKQAEGEEETELNAIETEPVVSNIGLDESREGNKNGEEIHFNPTSAVDAVTEVSEKLTAPIVDTNVDPTLTTPTGPSAVDANSDIHFSTTSPAVIPASDSDSKVEQSLPPTAVKTDGEPVATVTSELNGVLYEMVTKTEVTAEDSDSQVENDNDATVLDSKDVLE